MRHVDLCSGIGGFALGFEWAGLSSPVMFCDIEPWSRKILAKHWPDVPIETDVKELANEPNRNVPDCDILTAGYPCQPFSLAGQRRGQEDDRHIWPYILRIVAQKRPAWCVFENVYGHISLGLDQVLFDLEAEGYATRTFVVPACAADAPHRRDRVWIIARNLENPTIQRLQEYGYGEPNDAISTSQDVADTDSPHQQGRGVSSRVHTQYSNFNSGSHNIRGKATQFWLPEPAVGRVAHGIPRRVDRLKGLGNAIVPQIAMRIGQTIKAVHDIPAQGYAHNNFNKETT